VTRSALLLVSALILACGANGDGRASAGDKREWSILQGVELETRAQRVTQLQFRVMDGYELLGVPREGDARTIWVMLKPSHAPFYKQMPEGNFWLDHDQLKQLVGEERVTSTVESALRSHIRPD
jgi:hypothetical protein